MWPAYGHGVEDLPPWAMVFCSGPCIVLLREKGNGRLWCACVRERASERERKKPQSLH